MPPPKDFPRRIRVKVACKTMAFHSTELKNTPNINRRVFLTTSTAALCATSQAAVNDPAVAGISGYTYRTPAFKTGTRLLFQGDSITDMNRGRNESDRNHYLGHSYVYLIAARLLVERPMDKLEFFNRGVGSSSMPDMVKRWEKETIGAKPDLVSVLFGVNDVRRFMQGTTPEQWEADYRSVLDASRKANPGIDFVLLDPFVLPSGPLKNAGEFKKWRAEIDRMLPVVEKLSKEFSAVHIKTQAIFDAAAREVSPEHWIWDGIHPLPQGHELIARNWLQQTSAHWKQEIRNGP